MKQITIALETVPLRPNGLPMFSSPNGRRYIDARKRAFRRSRQRPLIALVPGTIPLAPAYYRGRYLVQKIKAPVVYRSYRRDGTGQRLVSQINGVEIRHVDEFGRRIYNLWWNQEV